jgi:hypothetical protein
MEAPYCKICETKHWNREPHVFSKKAKSARSDAAKAKSGPAGKPKAKSRR